MLITAGCYDLDCYYSFIDFRGNFGELIYPVTYTCKAKISFRCHDKSGTITGVSRNHMREKRRYDVMMLWLESEQKRPIMSIPAQAGKFFTKLEVLRIPFARISAISEHDMAQFSQLKCLYLGKNEIKSLSADLFRPTPHLEFVALNDNQISQVEKGLFRYLRKLKIFYFDGNFCVKNNPTAGNHIDDIKHVIRKNCMQKVRRNDLGKLKKPFEIEDFEKNLSNKVIDDSKNVLNETFSNVFNLNKTLTTTSAIERLLKLRRSGPCDYEELLESAESNEVELGGISDASIEIPNDSSVSLMKGF